MEGDNNGSSIFKPRISNLNNYRMSNVMEGGENGNSSLFYSKSKIFDNNIEVIQEETPSHTKAENEEKEGRERKVNKVIKKEEVQYRFLFFDEARFNFEIFNNKFIGVLLINF